VIAAATAAAVVGVLVAREHVPPTGGDAARGAAQLVRRGRVAPPLVTPWKRGPVAAGDLVLVPTGFHEAGRVRAYEARTGRGSIPSGRS
jgi:hypothetical protein